MTENIRKMAIESKMIPALVTSACAAFETMAFLSVTSGEPAPKEDSKPVGAISGTIGVTGKIELTGDELSGSVSLIFPAGLAETVFRSMMMMEADAEVDLSELQDAVGELANMCTGGAKAAMQDIGLNFMISLPSVVVGDNHHISAPAMAAAYVIPLTMESGTFFMEATFL